MDVAHAHLRHVILKSMQPQPTSNEPSSNSFAGLLSAITAAKAPGANSFADHLSDDVVTLSYDRALENHARYRSPDSESPVLDQLSRSASRATVATHSRNKLDRQRKCASVTIRMSLEECAQLHQRAAEANLTVSAYLRSCTFEAEALRAEVKQALAELRNPPSAIQQAGPAIPKWLRLIRRSEDPRKQNSTA